jgi:hypothetical protein
MILLYIKDERRQVNVEINIGLDRKKNPREYDRLWRREYNRYTANIKRKLADYRYMDKKDNCTIICDYTYEELLHILSTNKCVYCNSDKNLTLDRINNTKGHIKDNTVVACLKCNTRRGDKYTVEEAKEIFPLLDKIRLIELEIKKIIDRRESI